MPRKNSQVFVLCEDLQHATFIGRFLTDIGFIRRRIRVAPYPAAGKGSGEQFVRENYGREVANYRRRTAATSTGLVVMIDADTDPDGNTEAVANRYQQLDSRLSENGQNTRKNDESIALLVPKRNVETWIHALDGENVDEATSYGKLSMQRECKAAVRTLVSIVQNNDYFEVLKLPSLERGVSELQTRLPP